MAITDPFSIASFQDLGQYSSQIPAPVDMEGLLYYRDGAFRIRIWGEAEQTINTFVGIGAIDVLTGDVSATGPGTAVATIEAIQGNPVTGTTGTNSVVFSNSPTMTGILTVPQINSASGNLTLHAVSGNVNITSNVNFTPDNIYMVGNPTTLRPNGIYAQNIGAGLGSGETGYLKLGDQSSGAQLVGTATDFTIYANGHDSLYFDGNGNISFNVDPTLTLEPFFSFSVDGSSVLGGYPSPTVRTHFRPGYLAVKRAIGIGTGVNEVGALQLGDYTKGNIIYGNPDGSMNLWLNNLKILFIDSSGNWWLDQDTHGGAPAMIYTQDNYRSIGATSTTFRPSNVWVATSVGIGLAAGQSGTLHMGVGGATLVGDTSGNINVTLGASGAVNMNSKKITGLAPGTNPTDAVNFSQLGGGLSGVAGQVVVFNSSSTATGYAGFTSDTSGNVVTNTIQSSLGSATTVGIQVGSTGNTGLFSSANHVLDFATNGVSRMQFTAGYTLQVPQVTSGTGTAGNDFSFLGSYQTVASGTAKGGNLTINAGNANGSGSTGAGGNLNLFSGVPQGGNGGTVQITAGSPQDNSVAGGNGGAINLQAGAAGGDNSANKNGGAITGNAGTSKGSSTGGGITFSAGVGGPGTGTAGASGGGIAFNGGTGGVGSATSGLGGSASLKAGTGGAGVAGGDGGGATLTGGTAGAGSSSGGNGGNATVSGGSAIAVAGSNGGSAVISGAGGTSTGTGGSGGAVTITGGAAGGDNTVNQNGGAITITCGNSKGSANGRDITLNASVGGLGTGSTGANGGNININAGTGGNNATTSGNGGNLIIKAGTGGTTGTPGNGGDIQFYTATTTSNVERFRVSHTNLVEILQTGNGLGITHGNNCKLGTSALSSGTVTVSNTAITSNSLVFFSIKTVSGTPGVISLGTVSAGTSFVINSSSSLDNSTVAWLIIEGL